MKKRLLFSVLFLAGISLLCAAQATINVSLVYANAALSPIYNTQVLLKQGGATLATATTDTAGNSTFLNVAPGTYQCIPVCTLPTGGLNSSDALMIMIGFVSQYTNLSPIQFAAAEVNGQSPSHPNALDALLIVNAFVGMIPIFLPPYVVPGQPAWKYETINIVVSGSGTNNQQIKMLCTGDVNGSYVP